MGSEAWGLGFRVWGVRVQGLGFKDLEFRGLRVLSQGFGCRIRAVDDTSVS